MVTLASEGDVIVADGATIDISGGQIRFADGFIDTTQVVSDGVIYDIGTADPNRIYDAIADGFVKFHQRWGVTEVFTGFGVSPEGRFEAGYIEGKDAGTLSIRSYDALLDGTFLGHAVAGVNQLIRRRWRPGSPSTGRTRRRRWADASSSTLAVADDSVCDVRL